LNANDPKLEHKEANGLMEQKTLAMGQKKRVALVAHDNKKHDLLEWVKFNKDTLAQHKLYSTGTTGRMLEQELEGIEITRLQSGPLGGDQQIGAKVAEGDIDFMFSSPLMSEEYQLLLPDYEEYQARRIVGNE